ncbi:MAG: tRNA 2-thiouridine(34) synthase MnmA [Dehalococcoidia bacterium]|nr:tRNA 2-thiouridine(34) synthase MnmA [Dehalococcoidia bacterium]
MSHRKVAVALSGGVDSSVAAALLKEAGHEVIGVHMKLWQHRPEPDTRPPGQDDAHSVCRVLSIPFHSLDFSMQFQRQVVDYFCREYAQGRTPNPCVVCNRVIKFDLLLKAVEDLGAECLATGHYARIEAPGGNYHLLKAARPSVDQSYFLYMLKQGLLPRLLFPVGEYSKAQVRQMAAERKLPVAEKPKSQDLCFVPGGRHADFLQGRIAPVPGDIVDVEGKVLGRHRGVAFYTVGQRTGLGIATGQRLFVLRLDPVSNTVVVGPEENLLASRLRAGKLSFVCVKPQRPLEVSAKIRFRTPEVSARLKIFTEEAEVLFDQPQRAIAPGQAVVFYHGDLVLGGGIIEAS